MEIENPNQLRKIIKDEVERLGVRSVLRGAPKKTFIDYLKHPLVSLVIGFLLTGVAGTYLTHYFQSQEKIALLQREAHIHIRDFTQALSYRVTEAAYLRSAFFRPVENSILLDRKKSYDVSVKQWNRDVIKHLYTFREYSESPDRIFIERNIEDDLVPILHAIDTCLTEEFDNLQTNKSTLKRDIVTCWVLIDDEERSINLLALLHLSRQCGYKISDLLFSWVSINLKSNDDMWVDNVTKEHDSISQQCDSRDLLLEPSTIKPLYRTAIPLHPVSTVEQ